MPTTHKAPDDPWPSSQRGLEIILAPGTHQPGELSGVPDMVIVGGEGVIIRGSLRPGGGEDPCGLRIHDGADRLQILGPIEFAYSEGRGLRITGAAGIYVADIYCHHCGIEGVITGDCPGGTYERIRVEDSRSTPAGFAADKRHALYISGNADGSSVLDLTAVRVTGSALQVNGAGLDAIVTGFDAQRLDFQHVGSGNTPPISLMAVRNATISQFRADWVAGDRWAVCFDDGKGVAFACHGVVFREYSVPRGSICAIEAGSTEIECDPGAGWSPDATPEPPEPEPEPPPAIDVEAVLAALDSIDRSGSAIASELDNIDNQTAAIRSLVNG